MSHIKNDRVYGITDFQLYCLLVCTILGAGVTTLPRTTAQYADRDGWISILVSGLLIWLLTYLIYLLCARFPRKTLPDFAILILGKPLGIILTTGYIIYALSLGGSALRIFVELAKTWSMIWTPHWVFLTAILLVVIYTARMGASTLGRLSELIVYFTLPAIVLFILPLKEFQLLHILPIGQEGITAILTATPEASFAFLGFEIILVLFPLVVNKQKVFRVFTLALASVTLFYATNTILTYGVLSVEQTKIQVWPLINYMRIGTSPFLERLDNILLFIWTAQVFGVTAIQFFAGSFAAASLTNRSHHDIWVLVLAPFLYIITIFPLRIINVFSWADIVGSWGLVYIAGMVILLFLIAKLRKLDERENQ